VIARVAFPALGTSAVVAVAEADLLSRARQLLATVLERADRSCSRFRPDSELVAANRRSGSVVHLSGDLHRAVRAALDAAAATDGIVDPTLGAHLRAIGYDRTYARVRARGGWQFEALERPRGAWRRVELDDERRLLRAPAGTELDLGATAKALTADLAAQRIATETGVGALVSLGGDIAVAGSAPEEGWCVLVSSAHDSPLDGDGQRVALSRGGLATSSTGVRVWRTSSGEMHHLLDPRTGLSASTPWSAASVAADTCLQANVASTAAIILGDAAPLWLAGRNLPARLVSRDGAVTTTAGWPSEAA
jgi:FAD:protein FMN transferase